MKVFVDLVLGELVIPDTSLREYICYLADLHMKVQPGFRIILDESALHDFLCDDEIGFDFRIGPSLKIPEITLAQELHILRYLMVVELLAEDVLLLEGIPFAQCLHDVVENIHEIHIQLSIGAVLLHRILNLNDDGTVAILGEQDSVQEPSVISSHILQLGEIAVDNSFLTEHVNVYIDWCKHRFPCHGAWHEARFSA